MKIFIANSAYSDLDGIKEYYENEDALTVGTQFLTSIIEHIQTLADHPDIGRVVPEFDDVKIRELIHVPFRIVYLREKNSIHIIRVWRSERLLSLP
ncbi:MAG: type II toxin-antitoxin system RelE/ParE family toxin [Gammaproteobacteria bacterium]|nr:type II toxin-antitoxin system RelE/ParE family toxin [Gammaproteobacteria bacterium]